MALMPGKNGADSSAEEGSEDESTEPAGEASASDLVSRISADLTSLVQMMDKTKSFSPQDKAPAQKILQQFQDYAQNVLLASPDATSEPDDPAAPGPAPMEAGAAQARPY